MNYFVYILKSLKDLKLYIGVTGNLERRILQHNAGKNKSTKCRRPFILIYYEKFTNKKLAYKREWYFKNTGVGNIEMRRLAEVAKLVTAGL